MRTLVAIAFIAYPLAVYLVPETTPRSLLVGVFGMLASIRVLLATQLDVRQRAGLLLVISVFCLLAVAGPELTVLKTYPLLINLAGAGYGLYTLTHPPSAIERLARATGMTVDAAGARYTRGVTKLWVLFFLLNGLVSAYTALWCSTAVWSLYNGLISYCLVALLFAAEYCYRGYYRRRQSISP
ncbi:MAG: hypothetical protein ACR2PZ_01305 [Pseudomonadales bacterium]